METQTRRPRMSRDDKPKKLSLVSRDIEIFKLLNRYRFQRSSFINEHVGGHPIRLRHRLRDLYDSKYLARPEQQLQYVNARYMPMIYELDIKGERLLASYGHYSPFTHVTVRPTRNAPHHQFAHDLMVCDILSSIELGVKQNPKLRFISAHEILTKAPKETQQSQILGRISMGS